MNQSCLNHKPKNRQLPCHEHRQPNHNIAINPASRISLLERHQGVSARISKQSSTKSTTSQHDINSRLIKTPDKPSTPRQPYVMNKSDSSSPMSPHRIRKQSSHESTERQILHHKQISFHVSNASYQQSGQLQVIGQVSISSTIGSSVSSTIKSSVKSTSNQRQKVTHAPKTEKVENA